MLERRGNLLLLLSQQVLGVRQHGLLSSRWFCCYFLGTSPEPLPAWLAKIHGMGESHQVNQSAVDKNVAKFSENQSPSNHCLKKLLPAITMELHNPIRQWLEVKNAEERQKYQYCNHGSNIFQARYQFIQVCSG